MVSLTHCSTCCSTKGNGQLLFPTCLHDKVSDYYMKWKDCDSLLISNCSPPAKLGIIGDTKKKYDLKTLQSLEYCESEDDPENDKEASDSGSESIVSGIIEDEGVSDDLF